MAASMLRAAGYTIGLYTSPHLIEFTERIQVDGVVIPEEKVVSLTGRIQEAVRELPSPTFFEFITAMAFQYFADSRVDIAVVEVGMGGRCDATNVVEPVATAITTVSLDHQAFLGDTVEAIAYEKAGIIKAHVPVVVGRVSPKAAKVVQNVACKKNASCFILGTDFHCGGEGPDNFSYRGMAWDYAHVSCSLRGQHQLDNAACALALLEAGTTRGLQVSEKAIRAGLRTLEWDGRLEIAETSPVLLLDGAHNHAAAEALARYLQQFRDRNPQSRVLLLIGFLRDKDFSKILSSVLPVVDEVIVTQPDHPRAEPAEHLGTVIGPVSQPVHVVRVVTDALALARQLVSAQDLICVTGSLMLVGDMKAHLCGSGRSPIRG